MFKVMYPWFNVCHLQFDTEVLKLYHLTVWNNLSVPDKNIHASVTSVGIVIVDWSVDKQTINSACFWNANCSVSASVVHKR